MSTLVPEYLACCLLAFCLVSDEIANGPDQILNVMALRDLRYGVLSSFAVVMIQLTIGHIYLAANTTGVRIQCSVKISCHDSQVPLSYLYDGYCDITSPQLWTE